MKFQTLTALIGTIAAIHHYEPSMNELAMLEDDYNMLADLESESESTTSSSSESESDQED